MKYLYLDCFAGFDPLMLLGALVDMGQDVKKLQKSFPGSLTLSAQKVKRMGMDSTLVKGESNYPSVLAKKQEITELSEYICITDSHRELLGKYISIRSSAASLDDDSAVFDKKAEAETLSYLLAVSDAIKELGAKKIYVSTIFSSELSGLFGSYTGGDTAYISKKYGLKIRPAKENSEIFAPGGAAFLASLGAEHKEGFVPQGIIKIGYGAGSEELEGLPNILRIVLGEEGQEYTLMSENAFSERFFETFSMAGMKER